MFFLLFIGLIRLCVTELYVCEDGVEAIVISYVRSDFLFLFVCGTFQSQVFSCFFSICFNLFIIWVQPQCHNALNFASESHQ